MDEEHRVSDIFYIIDWGHFIGPISVTEFDERTPKRKHGPGREWDFMLELVFDLILEI